MFKKLYMKILIFAKQFCATHQSGAHGTCHACYTLDTPLHASDFSPSTPVRVQKEKQSRIVRFIWKWCSTTFSVSLLHFLSRGNNSVDVSAKLIKSPLDLSTKTVSQEQNITGAKKQNENCMADLQATVDRLNVEMKDCKKVNAI